MVNVKLHGVFENYVKLDWNLNILTVAEAFEAIEANTGQLISTLGILEEYINYYHAKLAADPDNWSRKRNINPININNIYIVIGMQD
jgi:hypothetical protein